MTPNGTKKIKAALVAVSCDLPARALVLNMLQYNCTQGCHLCEDTGKNSKLFRWWPYNGNQVLRTKDTLLQNAYTATSENKPVRYVH